MPEIDVSEVLLDTDIAGEPFMVIRNMQVVNDFGELQPRQQRFNAVGAIVPTGDNSLAREPDYQIQTKTIKVITTFLLRSVAQESGVIYDPDIVSWRGNFYVVKTLDDYSQYGIGMIEAECSSIDYVDNAPLNPENPSLK